MPYSTLEKHNAWARRYSAENYEKIRAVKRRSFQKHYQARLEHRRQRMLDPVERHKATTQNKFNRAVRNGWIKRPKGKIFHHPDYNRPYYGAWMTHLEHVALHRGLDTAEPVYTDYSEQVERIKNERRR